MMMLSSTEGREAGGVRLQDRPDPAGVVRRGEAVAFRGYVERYGEPPACFVGVHREGTLAPARCERPAVMEVYAVPMCAAHGEEAAAGALAEIAYDLDNELQRPVNGYVRPLSAHLEAAALGLGHGILGEEGRTAADRSEALLLAAFPLDRSKADAETLLYPEDPAARRRRDTPYDVFMDARMLLHRLMRLAFEEGADWLVETLEREREEAASQAAYALALDRPPA